MKIRKIFLILISAFLFASFAYTINNNKEIKETSALSLSNPGDAFKLLDSYYREDESFVYTAELHFTSGQAGGIAFGAKENEYYYVLNMDRYENRVKLLYFAKNQSPTELENDYFIGNNKITESELEIVKNGTNDFPGVNSIENVNLKVILTREGEHAYLECFVEGIKRFGVDSIIDLNNLSTPKYQGGYLGMNCFNADVYINNIEIGETDYSYFSEDYRNQYHLQPFAKWSNDPNGLCYYNGYYHVFYQTNPFATHWGPMYWGHARSVDLIHFEFLPICLFPETDAMGFGPGNGFMWSGCAVTYTYGMSHDIDILNWFPNGNGNGNGIICYFTRHGGLQDQIIMSSDDEGLTWTKRVRIPQNISGYNDFIDWRDPKVFPVIKDNYGNVSLWGMTLSSMQENIQKGWFLKSTNLLDWSFAGNFNFPNPECIGVGYLKDEFDVEHAYLTNKSRSYIFGRIGYDEYNGHIKFYDENDVDISTYSLQDISSRLKTLDFGPDSYASQTFYINDPNSEFYAKEIALNWFSPDPNIENSYSTGVDEYASIRGRWNGGFTIPVEYGISNTYEGYRLSQKPITVNNSNLEKNEIVNIDDEYLSYGDVNPLRYVDTHVFELSASIHSIGGSPIIFKVDVGNNEYMEFGWNSTDGYYVDRTNLNDKGINTHPDWHRKYVSNILGDSEIKTFYVLSDNGGLEVFAENYSISFYFLTTASKYSTRASLEATDAFIDELVINEIASAYQQKINKDNRYIQMRPTAFSNYVESAGRFASRFDGYWNENYSFHALDTFFRGENGTSSDTSLMLKAWKQNTQYIYFSWGGAPNYSNDIFLRVYCGDNNEFVTNVYNDTHLGNAMMLKYFKIPDNTFNALIAQYPSGFDMKIELVDLMSGISGYAFHNFGYLHINQNLEEVREAMYYYLNCLDENRSEIDVRNIQALYYTNNELNEVFYHPVNNIDDDFEYQDDFERNWYFDKTYYEDSQNKSRHLGKAISRGEIRPGDSQMPFNKTGDAFFRGWYEEEKDSGFIGGDSAIYRFISKPFILNDDALISIKMAGTARIYVIDPLINPGNNQAADIASITNQAYNTSGDEILTNDFNTCTMVRHVINLSAYKNRTIQLAIADYSSGGWGAAYFDELKVNLDLENVGFKIDLVTQNHKNGNSYKQVYLDKYVSTSNIDYVDYYDAHSDNSYSKEAYEFINNYLNYTRSEHGQANVCDDNIRKSDTMKLLLNAYNSLSNDAKRIVCSSNDFQRNSGDLWYISDVSVFNLGESIRGIAYDNGVNVTIYNGVLNLNQIAQLNDNSQLIIISTIAFMIIAMSFVYLRTYKKENR